MKTFQKSFIEFVHKQNIGLYNVKSFVHQFIKRYYTMNENPYYYRTISNFRKKNLDTLNQQKRYITFFYPNLKEYSEGFGNRTFWEPNTKGKYKVESNKSKYQLVKEGFFEIKPEIRKWREEMKAKFEADPIFVRPGDTDRVFNFKTKEDFDRWMIVCDKDHDEGFSSAALTKSTVGHGLFSGVIDKTVMKDGENAYAGYANMQTCQLRKSFKRDTCYDWFGYTHLVMRIRGDGRRYLLVLSTAGTFDLSWFDIYSYVLYTRGGPYWQDVKIPFSKFFLTSKGRVQDKQGPVDLSKIKRFGITAADRVSAPFRLEIDYIGIHCDPSHDEKFAYELYRVPRYIV